MSRLRLTLALCEEEQKSCQAGKLITQTGTSELPPV